MVLHGWFSVDMCQQNGYFLYLQNSKEVQVTCVTDGYYHKPNFSDVIYVGVLEKFSRSFISSRYKKLLENFSTEEKFSRHQYYVSKIKLEYPEFNSDDVLSENSLKRKWSDPDNDDVLSENRRKRNDPDKDDVLSENSLKRKRSDPDNDDVLSEN